MVDCWDPTPRLLWVALLFSCACSLQQSPAGGLSLDAAQALVDDHYVDVNLVVVDVRDDGGRTVVAATAGQFWTLEVEFEDVSATWQVKGAFFDGRPVPELAPGLLGLNRSIEELRVRNTISAMRYIAEGLAEMHGARGRYATSLEELAELGHVDLVRLDETVNRATEMKVLRTYPGFPIAVGALVDAWVSPWVYEPNEGTYTLTSTGSDGAPGPPPPHAWLGWPFEADLIMVDGEFVQAPARIAATGTPADAISLPRLVGREPSPDDQMWVATSAMFDASARLLIDPNVLPKSWFETGVIETVRRQYEGLTTGTLPGTCLHWRHIVEYATLPPVDFESVVSQARALIRGTVVGTAGGFLDAQAGIMLEIAIAERRMGDFWYPEQDHLFVFRPGGRVPFGATSICSSFRDPARAPAPPSLGDEVLFLPHTNSSPLHSSIPIVRLDPRGFELFYERAGEIRSASSFESTETVRDARSLRDLWFEAESVFGRNQ